MNEDQGVPAWHYDGRSAVRHRVHLFIADGALHIAETGATLPLDRLRASGEGSIQRFSLIDRPGWRIELDAPVDPAWLALLPRQEKHGRLMDRFGVWPVLIVAAGLAVIAILMLGAGTGVLARAIPLHWEIALGETVSGRMDQNNCAAPAGRAALDRLVTRLHPDGLPVRVVVVDLPIVNAVTLPGRQVVLFRGLLDQAQSPDEVAGVLAHEFGHVEHRDAMVALLRGYGLSLLLGGVDGGAITQTLISNRYSRDDERAADAAGLAVLARARVSPRATAGLFDRLSKIEPGGAGVTKLFALLSTHPLSAERRQAFLTASIAGATPSLSAADWLALKTSCRE
jgi:Zn-dependent protease with chaperone function